MTDDELPEPDDRFCKLVSNQLATKHLFIAEGEGAHYVLDLLSLGDQIAGHKAVYYADTAASQSPGLADGLLALQVAIIEILPNRLQLLQLLPRIFSQWSMPVHVHVAASGWFIEYASALAEHSGISKEDLTIERYEPFSRKISCVICGGRTQSHGLQPMRCSACGTHMQISHFYNRQNLCHLGVPSDWSTNNFAQ
jgi:hypothetical protein